MTFQVEGSVLNDDISAVNHQEEATQNGAEEPDNGAKAAALAAIAKLQASIANKQSVQNNGDDVPEVPAENGDSHPKPKKKRFGPPANAPREAPKKRRRTRWERAETSTNTSLIVQNKQLWPTDVTLPGGVTVVLPPHLTGRKMSHDPVIQGKYETLWKVEDDIREGRVDIPPEGERSPSPPPVYDRFGIRQNTREFRYKEKLLDQRCNLIEELIKIDKTYQPPSDYRPRKKHRKIFIPYKEYPGYNFIGLIIGPRGNTQKRMQMETNTKIAIRGRGSVKEGAARDPKYDYGEDEELHVLISGDSQEDVDRAAEMIEDLLQPQDETRLEHKRMQLRELAALNGTLKDEEAPQDQLAIIAGDKAEAGVYQLPSAVQSAAQEQYARDIARVHGTTVQSEEAEYQDFLASLGGGPGRPPPGRGRPGLGMRPDRPGDDLPDNCKLYIGGLADSIDDSTLKSLFEPYGQVLHAAVIRDPSTGSSRSYGFVHFPDPQTASAAVEAMHGKIIESRNLVVRLRSDRGQVIASGAASHEFNEAKLYCGHLPEHVNDDTIRSLFETVAPVADVRVIMDKMTGQSKGFAFITMGSKDGALQAIARLDGYQWDGHHLSIRVAGDKTRPGRPPGMQGAMPPGFSPGAPGFFNRPPPGPYPGMPPPAFGGQPPQMFGAGGYGVPGGPPMPPYPGGAPPMPYPGQAGPPPGAPYMPPPYPGAPPPMPYPGAPAPAPVPGQMPPPYGSVPGHPGTPGHPVAPIPGHPPPPGGAAAVAPSGLDSAPPLPPSDPPAPPAPPPAPSNADSEYEKFMSELGQQ